MGETLEKFKYTEMQPNGKRTEGEIEARSKEEVERTIRSRGGIPVSIEPAKSSSILNSEINISFLEKVKLEEIAVFSKQMATMLSSGMTLVRSLDVVSEQSDNKLLKKVTREMSLEIQKGNTLSNIMRRYPKIFPELMLSMIEAGELTGQIDNTFENLNVHYTKEAKINKKIKGAMTYPIVLSIVAVGILVMVFTFVIPSFIDLYAGQELPALTQGLIDFSDFFLAYWYLIFVAIGGIIFGVNRAMKTNEGKKVYDTIIAKIPILGKSTNTIATSRFTRTLGTLLASGVSIIAALEASSELTKNRILIEKMEYVVEEIKKGRSLGTLLKEINYFPPMMVSMVGVGEESGDLDGMLAKTADYYDEELDAAITTMLNLIEPVMIVIMGGGVGFIVLAIMMPMFNMYSNMQGTF